MMRFLPMRRASSAWPRALLILCAPVLEQVLPFEIDLRAAAVLRQPLGEIQLRRPAGELLEVVPQFLLKLRIRPGLLVGGR